MMTGVEVIAVAARTPVGLYAESAAAAVRAGVSRLGEHPEFVDGAGDPLRCARDPELDPGVRGAERLSALCAPVLRELAEKVFGRQPAPVMVPVYLAVPEPRPGFMKGKADEIRRSLLAIPLPKGVQLDVQFVEGGHAGGLRALELASFRLAQRQAEVCFVGGVDSYLDADTLDWLEDEGRVARSDARGGFPPGEAAGMLALATRGVRSRLGLSALASLLAVATGKEPRAIDGDEGLLGDGLTHVIRQATQDLRLPQERVDDVYCDINGERHRSDEWGFMLLKASSAFRDGTAYVSPVSSWGDVGAASGVLGCVLAVQSWQRSYATGPRALVCASSPEGMRGAAILEATGG
jgi:3-oxoacyl-[acyl-carrier-protein] synthase-1